MFEAHSADRETAAINKIRAERKAASERAFIHARRMIADEGVFSSDQISALDSMIAYIEDAVNPKK